MACTRKHVAASTNNPETSHTPKEQMLYKNLACRGSTKQKYKLGSIWLCVWKFITFAFFVAFVTLLYFQYVFSSVFTVAAHFFHLLPLAFSKEMYWTKFSTFACLFICSNNHSFSLCIFIIYQHSLHSLPCDFAWQVKDAEINPRFYIRVPSPLADGYHIGFVTADDKLRVRNSSGFV